MVFRHRPDVGPASLPTSSLLFSDVGLMSFPILSLSDSGMMSARYRFRHLADIESLWFSDIDRPDVGLMSFPTSSLFPHRPDVGTTSARYRFRHQADINLLVFRHRPDIEYMSVRCRPDVVSNIEPLRHRPDVGPISFPTSGRHRASVVFRHRPDIESMSARCRFNHQASQRSA